MLRLRQNLIAVAAAAVAASVVVLLLVRTALPFWAPFAIIAGAMVVAYLVSEIMRLRRTVRDLAHDTDRLEANVRSVKFMVAHQEPAQAVAAPRRQDNSAAEIAALGAMVKDLADAVSEQEGRIATLTQALAGPKPQPATPPPAAGPTITMGVQSHVTRIDPTDISIALSRDALETFLQPVVTLPQRKVRFYQITARVRKSDGSLLLPDEFMPVAQSSGLAPAVDRVQFSRSSRLLRHLAQKNSDVTLLMNLSRETVAMPSLCEEVRTAAIVHPEIAPGLVFELPQAVFDAPSASEQDGLRMLAATGIGFAMDHVTSLAIDPRIAAAKNVKLVRVPVDMLLAAGPGARGLVESFRRSGIDLVAERIETERAVADVLELDIGFGQGHVFSPPRPVRSELLKSEGTAAARQAAPPQAQAPARSAPARTPTAETDATLAAVIRDLPQAGGTASPGRDDDLKPRSAWRTLARRVPGSRTEP